MIQNAQQQLVPGALVAIFVVGVILARGFGLEIILVTSIPEFCSVPLSLVPFCGDQFLRVLAILPRDELRAPQCRGR